MEAEIRRIVSQEVTRFSGKDVKTTLLHRGTNEVYKVEAIDVEPAIFRHFGSTPVINRQVEHSIFLRIARAGLGPGCIAVSPHYRIEEFMSGRQVKREEVPLLVEPIATRLAQVHSLEQTSGYPASYYFFTQWKDLFERNLMEYEYLLPPDRRRLLYELSTALNEEQSHALALVQYNDDLVFSHNDMSYTNLLRHPKGIHLLDYEYAGLNYPGFDLAMLDNELGYECCAYQSGFRVTGEGLSKQARSALVDTYCAAVQRHPEEVERQFPRCKAVAHYGCLLWALCHYRPDTETWFDLLHFAAFRLDCYRRALELAP